jgi:hypothetical protein
MYNFLNSWFDKKSLPILRVAFFCVFLFCFVLTTPLENCGRNFTQGILLQKVPTKLLYAQVKQLWYSEVGIKRGTCLLCKLIKKYIKSRNANSEN